MAKQAKHVRQMTAAQVRAAISEGEHPKDVAPGKSYSTKRAPQWFEVTADYEDIEGKRYRKGDILTQRQGRNVQVQDLDVGWKSLSSRQSAYRKMRNPDDRTRRAMQAIQKQARERGMDINLRGEIRNERDLKARESFGVFYLQNKRENRTAAQHRGSMAFLTAIGWDTGFDDPEDVWNSDEESVHEWWLSYREAS
jgi:hypothetical protein